tara:strand:+ start:126 stop:635 length:510 start_codon:yes stop_codon:yes gene_type:complete
MSKIGRAARVGSRQRPEFITDDITLEHKDSGEVYLVSGSDATASAVKITLPTPKSGSYFKFIIGRGMTGSLHIQGASDGDYMAGHLQEIDGLTDTKAVLVNGTTHDSIILTSSAQVNGGAPGKVATSMMGSYIECVSFGSGSTCASDDLGTAWYVTGFCTGSDWVPGTA